MDRPEVFISSIDFNDNTHYDFLNSDIVVFTGANNSGKSQVLRDIKSYFENKNSPRLIANNIKADYIGNPQYFKDNSKYRNGSYFFEGVQTGDLNYLVQSWNNQTLNGLSNYFINHLSTESRLYSANPAGAFDAVNESPHHPIQRLYIEDKKEGELSSLFHKAFNTDIIVNRGAGSSIPIHVGASPQKANGEDRVSMTN